MKKMESNELKATFGGGCFWCTEAIFQRLKGVTKIESGYSGGKIVNPTYREVCSGMTGHAEVVEVSYNPSEISYEDLMKIHLTTHDPTTLNQQGGDRGTQYRSIIFFRNEAEKEMATKAIAAIQPSFDQSIVTELKAFQTFYTAEVSHQNYYNDNQNGRYCQAVIDPKLRKFKDLYKDKLK